MKRQAIYRLLDANFNRAKEGLRVAEDVMRFVYNDRLFSSKLKMLRHEVSKILLGFPVTYARLIEARSSSQDVGRDSTLRDELKANWKSLVIRNIKRAQEAVRVLEEASGVVAPKSVARLERLRFKTYELEKGIIKKLSSLRSH